MKSLSALVRLKYWWFRRQNGYPCHREMIYVLARTPLRSFRVLTFGTTYCENLGNLELTAKDLNVTRERTRQVLWKLWRSVMIEKCFNEAMETYRAFDKSREENFQEKLRQRNVDRKLR
jgi:hypothetical protein